MPRGFPSINLIGWAALGSLSVAAYAWGGVWAALPPALAASLFANGCILILHEGVHGGLARSRALNDLAGQLIGGLLLTPFTAYRAVHLSHHGMLASDDDLEIWPYVSVAVPRWIRVACVLTELTAPLLFYPVIYYRAFRSKRVPARWKRSILVEATLISGVGALVVALVASTGTWSALIFAYLLPAGIAALIQSWRKLVRHLGLFGSEITTLTRTIYPSSALERLYCLLLLNEPYHAPHHLDAKAEWRTLPERARELLHGDDPAARRNIHASYLVAIPEMLSNVWNPRIGPQWAEGDASGAPRQ